MSLNVGPDIEAGLQAIAQAHGLSVEDYLHNLVKKELPQPAADSDATHLPSVASGMVREHGLLIYRTGKPLTVGDINDAIQRSRDDRIAQILGNPR